MKEYLLKKKEELEKSIAFQKSVDAQLTVAVLQRDLEIINLALAGLELRCPKR